MRRPHLNLDLRGVIIMIAVGVLLPVMLAAAVGIVALVLASDAGGFITGVLVVCFAVAAMGSALVAVVLTSRKLRLARRQSDFLAGVSHEFRTPISAIRLYAQTLQSGKLVDDPASREECIAVILRETAWLDLMVEQLLTWRTSSAGLLELAPQWAPVGPAVEAAVNRFRSMVAEDEVALELRLQSERPARHDERLLNAVVVNLLTNAYKYTGSDKSISVTVDDEGAQVVVRVRDNGCGIPARIRKQVFKPFYRGTDRRGGHTGGVGLGLAIARYMVEQQGGTIGVETPDGKGAQFAIRLDAQAGDTA